MLVGEIGVLGVPTVTVQAHAEARHRPGGRHSRTPPRCSMAGAEVRILPVTRRDEHTSKSGNQVRTSYRYDRGRREVARMADALRTTPRLRPLFSWERGEPLSLAAHPG